MNLEYNADTPSARCDRHDNLLLVPNGETGSARGRLIQGQINRIRGTGRTYEARSKDKRRQWLCTQITRDQKRKDCHTLFPLRFGALRLGASEEFTHK